jgi:FkbM family methyltransferase
MMCKKIMYGWLRLLNVTWGIASSGCLRLLPGRSWLYESEAFNRINQILSYQRYRLFFSTRKLGNGFVQTHLPDGVVTQPNDSCAFGYETYVLNVYDKLHSIRSKDVVIDVGAHVGVFTLKAAKRAKNGLIVAIEPHPLNFVLLQSNIRENKLENVIALNIALADSNNWTRLYISKESGGHTIAPRETRGRELDEFVKVRARTLDSVINELGIKKVDFIKVDAEGVELKVLAGAQNALKNSRGLRLAIASYHYLGETREVSEFLALRGFTVSRSRSFVYGIA